MTQTLLFSTSPVDPCARKHGGVETSVEAFSDKGRDREEVYRFIAQAGASGATLDEICEAMGRPGNALSGRIVELRKAGRIYVTGFRRPTRTGKSARVYRVTG